MPREKINQVRRAGDVRTDGKDSSEPLIVRPPTAAAASFSEACVQVNWHREGEWVQVAIEGDLSYFRFVADHPNGETSDRSTVYTPPLSRDEINKLIRTLRRARDQVFGRDE